VATQAAALAVVEGDDPDPPDGGGEAVLTQIIKAPSVINLTQV
jgi:hypothetical protein